MVCKVCGRTVGNEHSNFCEYCGASFREIDSYETANQAGTQNQQMYQQNQPQFAGSLNQQWGYSSQGMNQQNMYQRPIFQNQVYSEADGKRQPISFLNWLGTMLLPYIPVVGWIAYLIMLFVWSFGKGTDETKKNWARARLVSGIIIIILGLIYITMFFQSGSGAGMNLQDYLQKSYY